MGLIPTRPTAITEISTFTDGLRQNDDGSVDIYFGPVAPEDNTSIWTKTNSGEYWFTCFRLYAPTETYFDRSWPMNDIQRVEEHVARSFRT